MYFASLLMLLVAHGINTQEYQRPFYVSPPRGPTIPPGTPWPASAAGYGNFSQTTRPSQNNQTNVVNRVEVVPPTGSNNNLPSFHPNPGNTIGPIIPTGTPWPANSEGYSNFSQTTIRPQVNQPSVVNRIEEIAQTRPNTNLPSFHPNPGSSLGPIIPPGTPWPANPEGYSNFSQTTIRPQVNQSSVVNRIEEIAQTRPNTNLPSFHPNPGSSLGPIIPPGTPWPANPEGYSNFSQTTIRPQVNQPNVVNRIEEVAQTRPNTNLPSFHPNPGSSLGPIIPPGTPWPANPEGYSNFSQTTIRPQVNQSSVVNRIEEIAQTRPNTNLPSFHPNPGSSLGPIIPPGTPWPANSQGYSNFSQTTIRPLVNQPNVVNRIEEVAQTRPNTNLPSFHPNPGSSLGPIIPPGTPWPANSEGYSNFSQTTIRPQVNQPNVVNRIEEVAQTRPNTNLPSFHPNPGSHVGQIIPSGTPWPANSEGYANFSQTTVPSEVNQPKIVGRIEEAAQFDRHPVPSKQRWPFNPYGYNRLYRLISAEESATDSTKMSTTPYDEDDEDGYESDSEETTFKTTTKPTHNIQKIKIKTKPGIIKTTKATPRSREVLAFQGRDVLAPPPSNVGFFEDLFDNFDPGFAQSRLAPPPPLFLPTLG